MCVHVVTKALGDNPLSPNVLQISAGPPRITVDGVCSVGETACLAVDEAGGEKRRRRHLRLGQRAM